MPTGMLLRGNRNQCEHLILHYAHLNQLISRSMNGSARGSLMFEMEGKWTTKDVMLSQGFVCEKKTGDFCIFDMVPYGSGQCVDFRLDTRKDLHTWQGARDQCEVYGMKMPKITVPDKDEFINNYLVGTDLFPVDGDTNGIWIGARGKCMSMTK
jgi:hypothetical protein